MATYSFKVTKGKYELELKTTDKDLLVEQFGMWVRQAGEYARQQKVKGYKDVVNKQIQDEEEITNRNIENQIKQPEYKKEEEPSVIDEPIQNEQNNETNTQTEDALNIFYSPSSGEKTVSDIENNGENKGVFDSILENSMNNPQTELSFKTSPSIKKDNAFLNYITGRKIEKKIDYLLLTAYYFSQYEQRARFTLKQLNAKLMQNLAVIIDHSVLQEAINRDYIECLPDLTGLVGASEYRLTAYGEKTLMEE